MLCAYCKDALDVFYITGAFIAERTVRDLYVFIDVECFILVCLLYGLNDAAKIFNDGLVLHLFIMWTSVCLLFLWWFMLRISVLRRV